MLSVLELKQQATHEELCFCGDDSKVYWEIAVGSLLKKVKTMSKGAIENELAEILEESKRY